jgi:hypothetical protein
VQERLAAEIRVSKGFPCSESRAHRLKGTLRHFLRTWSGEMRLFSVRTHVGVVTKNVRIWARSHEEAYNQALLDWNLKESQVKEAIIVPLSR